MIGRHKKEKVISRERERKRERGEQKSKEIVIEHMFMVIMVDRTRFGLPFGGWRTVPFLCKQDDAFGTVDSAEGCWKPTRLPCLCRPAW